MSTDSGGSREKGTHIRTMLLLSMSGLTEATVEQVGLLVMEKQH